MAITHEEYYVGVRQKYYADRGDMRYYNALGWYPGHKPGQRYVRTEDEARRVLNHAYELWNGEKVYDANGKRYETHAAGALGVNVEHTRETDDRMKIVAHIIKKRTVTEWETINE